MTIVELSMAVLNPQICFTTEDKSDWQKPATIIGKNWQTLLENESSSLIN